nr:GNAT family N-acetyltransferase [uncultured Dethiosulfovibrio sp.]
MGRVEPLRILALTGVEPAGRPDNTDSIRCRDMAAHALTSLGHTVVSMDIAPEDMEDLPSLKDKILDKRCHVALNFFEGFSTSSEQEVCFASLLEEIMPFTGNGAKTLRICLDKEAVRERLMERSVAVPDGFSVKDPSAPRLQELSFPLFLKPTSEDGSVGIGELSLVSDKDELNKSIIGMLQDFPQGITVESFIDGPEYSVGLLGDYPYRALPVSCIDYGRYPDLPPYLGYDSKWDPASLSYSISPTIGEVAPEKEAKIVDLARAAGKALDCRGPFRVDMRERDGGFFVLDVNPNPDLNDDSGFLRQCRKAGLNLPELMDGLVRSALVRRLTDMGRETGAFSTDEVQVLEEVLSAWAEAPDQDYSLLIGDGPEGIWGFVIYGRTAMTDFSWDLYWIVVDRASQGKGRGKKLVKDLESELLSQGDRAIVRVETSGQEAYRYQRDFYSSTGFDECGRIRDFYHSGDDLVIYCRYLDGEGL